MYFKQMRKTVLSCIVMFFLLLTCCNRADYIEPLSSEAPEAVSASQTAGEASSVSKSAPESAPEPAPEQIFINYIYRLDLNAPPEVRKWDEERLQTPKKELLISDFMWILRGETEFENLPEVATLTLDGSLWILNITSPDFVGDESLYINACMTYFLNNDEEAYTRLSFLATIYVEYFGEPATDLPVYNGGAFQFPYYSSRRPVDRVMSEENTGGPGIWLPRELWAVQENARIPIITETPYEATAPIFFDSDGLPDDWTEQLNKLSSAQQAQIKEMYNSADPVKNKLQGYITRVMPDLLRVGNETPLYFSKPSEASALFVQETALRFAEYSAWDKYYDFEDYRNISDKIAPIAELADNPPDKYGILGIDVETAAKEIFGDIEVRHSPLNYLWSKGLIYNEYTNIYRPGLSGMSYSVKMYPIILEYKNIGDGYEMTVVQLWYDDLQWGEPDSHWSDDPLAWYGEAKGHTFEPAGFLEQVQTELPKLKIVLKNKPGGNFIFYSYEPL